MNEYRLLFLLSVKTNKLWDGRVRLGADKGEEVMVGYGRRRIKK